MTFQPFIEVSVVQTTDDKMKILTFLEKRTKSFHKVEIQWIGTAEHPILRIIFPSEQALIDGYARDQFIYEGVVHLINEGIITPTKISQVLMNDVNSDNLYLILKYTTNCKDPIRNNYRFTFKIAEMFGINMSYEEVHDGFILFYKDREDFEIGIIDLTQIDKVKPKVEARGHWKKTYEKLWKNIEKKI